jgi:hypothetical protein
MARENRPGTRGNIQVDYTALRADINNINPVVKSTLRNAVPRNGQSPERDEMQGKTTVNAHKLERLSNIISNNINAATDLRQITPYIGKAELIWDAIMLYPNGKQEKTLNYDTRPSKLKNSKLHDELLRVWDNYYTNDYKIEADLRPMVHDMLWNTGSYVLFNLSRPGLDYLINGSELLAEDKGMAGRAGNEAYEAYKTKAQHAVDQEFVKTEGGKYVARNRGRFVRDPHAKTTVAAVSGLEAIMSGRQTYAGNEFSLFGDNEVADDKGAKVKVDFGITLTDNPSLLYLQKLSAVTRQTDVDAVMGTEDLNLVISSAMIKGKEREEEENKKKGKKAPDPKAQTQNLTEQQADALSKGLFPNRNVGHQSIQFVKTNDSLSGNLYGRGLTWHVPSEAVIPIHRQGSNGKHEDYIFLLDDEGNFLKNTADAEYYQSMKKNANSISNKPKGGSTDSLISNLKTIQDGKDCEFDMAEFAEMAKASIVRQFMSAIISGKGDNISISIDEETNKIFLARMFKRQSVRCLYVPGESVTYMAFNYNRLGIGQSLTQAAKMHIARLAAFDVADAMANLEAAQPHSLMSINIAKEDPDPAHTIAIARSVFFEANPRIHSILSTAQLSVPQIVDALRESSLTVKINAGENPHMPAPDIDISHMDKQVFKPVDQASRDEVLNKISNYFGLPRSWLDIVDGGENQFQIEALTEHQMLLNQGANWQDQWCDMIMDFERKHTSVNGPLLNDLVKVIVDNKPLWVGDAKEPLEGSDEVKIKILLTDFINNIYCWLPTPASTESHQKLKEKLEAVDALVEAWTELSGYEKMLPVVAKALGLEEGDYNADTIKEALRAAYTTEAFKRFNMPMPFDEIVSEGKGGGMASLVNAVVHQRVNLAEFLAKLTIDVSAADKKLIKEHQPKIAKALTALEETVNKVTGAGDEGQPGGVDGDGNPIPGGDDGLGGAGDGLDDGLGGPPDDDSLTPPDDGAPPPDDADLDAPPDDDALPPDDDASTKDDDSGDGLDPAKNDPTLDPFTGTPKK